MLHWAMIGPLSKLAESLPVQLQAFWRIMLGPRCGPMKGDIHMFFSCNTMPANRAIHRRMLTELANGSPTPSEAKSGNGAPKRGVPQGIPKKTMSIAIEVANSDNKFC